MTEFEPNQPSDAELREVAARIRAASAEVRAPETLRARIESAARGAKPERSASGRQWWARWPAFAVAGVAALAVAVAVITLPGADPSVTEAAGLAQLSPTEPPPPARPDEPALLAANFEGLSYPDWSGEFGWRAVGERTEELDGRDAHTVFYENDEGRRIGYTIVSGEALDPPEGGERKVVDGVELDAFTADGTPAVTWLRDGHSCVLAGDGVERDTLLELAAWKGDGAVAF